MRLVVVERADSITRQAGSLGEACLDDVVDSKAPSILRTVSWSRFGSCRSLAIFSSRSEGGPGLLCYGFFPFGGSSRRLPIGTSKKRAILCATSSVGFFARRS